MNPSTENQITRDAGSYTFRQRLPRAILVSLALPLTLFYGVFELYASNMEELDFAFGDFVLPVSLICSLLFFLLCAFLIFLRGRAFEIGFASLCTLSVLAYVQGNFLNVGVDSLAADGIGMKVNPIWEVFNGILWILVIAGVILAVCLVRDRKVRTGMHGAGVFLMILIMVMQIASFTVNGIAMDVFAPKTVPKGTRYILTEQNLLEVSSRDNILVFILDGYDTDYMDAVVEEDPDFFEPLDGFTCYHDNMSWYTRTFPAATSMITGIKNDFSTDASMYFEHAYLTSPFLRDLKANDYKVNLFIDDYYSYRDARILRNIADNVDEADSGYIVQNVGQLCLHLIGVSAYRYAPIPLKRVFDLSTESFKGFVQYTGSRAPAYHSNDIELFKRIRDEGLTVQDEKNTYMFLHLWGCHTPYRMDEDGNATAIGTVEGATRGDMNLIYAYIDELKRLGVYENSTIVITGDHPGRYNDYENLPHSTLTALFFKPKGASGTPLAHSYNPVSQDRLIPSLTKSAGLETVQNYGDTYWDAPMDERRYYFLKNVAPTTYHVVEYRVKGNGRMFENWEIISEHEIGYLYD